jgi:hypothetical protein
MVTLQKESNCYKKFALNMKMNFWKGFNVLLINLNINFIVVDFFLSWHKSESFSKDDKHWNILLIFYFTVRIPEKNSKKKIV